MSPQPHKSPPGGALPSGISTDLAELLRRASDLSLIVDARGVVLRVICGGAFRQAARAAAFEGQALRETLTVESREKFDARLAAFRAEGRLARPVELNHIAGDAPDVLAIRYDFHPGGAPGEILLLGRDLGPVAEVQQQLVAAQLRQEQDFEARRALDTRFRVLLSSIAAPVLFVSLPGGRISDCNEAARQMLTRQGGDLAGLPLADVLRAQTGPAPAEKLAALAREGGGAAADFAVRASGQDITVTPTLFRAGGDQALMCQLQTQAADAAPAPVDPLEGRLAALYRLGAEAIVFVDGQGVILNANDAFLDLADLPQGHAVEGAPLADFLGRGGVDVAVLTENAARTGAVRGYGARVTGAFGAQREVAISATALPGEGSAVIALVLRDAAAAGPAQAADTPGGDVDAHSVVALIGSRPLRDIVAGTTDVVERLCIEKAIELTHNNRVAAAEMLGLSRQSLYVKLRKHGLLKAPAPE